MREDGGGGLTAKQSLRQLRSNARPPSMERTARLGARSIRSAVSVPRIHYRRVCAVVSILGVTKYALRVCDAVVVAVAQALGSVMLQSPVFGRGGRVDAQEIADITTLHTASSAVERKSNMKD